MGKGGGGVEEEEEEGVTARYRTTEEINGSLTLSADRLRQYIINTILILISGIISSERLCREKAITHN